MGKKTVLAIALLFCSFAAAQERVHIGQAVVALTGPWKFHIEDSPLANGSRVPHWSDPDFDDSGWENMDLTPKGATDYTYGMAEYVPGWTALGHPGYAGFAWYRLKVNIEHSDAPLSLLMPLQVNDGYQVFANGNEIGHFGDLTRRKPVIYFTMAEWFALPAAAPGKSTELAIRFYVHPSTLLQPDAGGMHGPPRVGAAQVIAAFGDLARQRFLMAGASAFLALVVYFGFAFALLAPWWLDRSETVYVWFASAYFALALTAFLLFLAYAVEIPVEAKHASRILLVCWVAFLIRAWWMVPVGGKALADPAGMGCRFDQDGRRSVHTSSVARHSRAV